MAPISRPQERHRGGLKQIAAELGISMMTVSRALKGRGEVAEARPRLGAVSFLHRFGSALNHHVHLHACVTDGVFLPAADEAGCDAPPAFLPARSITQADLTTLTDKVRRRVVRWFSMQRLLDTAAAAEMLAWENSGFSIDASVRITLIDRDVPRYFRSKRPTGSDPDAGSHQTRQAAELGETPRRRQKNHTPRGERRRSG